MLALLGWLGGLLWVAGGAVIPSMKDLLERDGCPDSILGASFPCSVLASVWL